MKQCVFCFQDDLDDRATRCPHCGTWLDGGERQEQEFDRLRVELQTDIRESTKDYQSYLKGIFTNVQYAAGIILTLVIGASAWFGYRTDSSITEVKKEIIARIETEFHSEKIQELMGRQISVAVKGMEPVIKQKAEEAAKSSLEQVSMQADKVLKDVRNSGVEAQEAVGKATAIAKNKLAKTLTKIESLDDMTGEVRKRLVQVEKTAQSTTRAFVNASRAPVEKVALTLPLERVEWNLKSGTDQIERMVEDRSKSLWLFVDGGGYYGPAIWQYLANLTRLPEFRYVILTSQDSLFGVYDASVLASALDPLNTSELMAKYPLGQNKLPSEEEVKSWTDFANLLNLHNDDSLAKLTGLPGFVSSEDSITPITDKRKVLRLMKDKHVDWLPVVDGPGRQFIGVIDRSRLTSSLLLEIASEIDKAQ